MLMALIRILSVAIAKSWGLYNRQTLDELIHMEIGFICDLQY